MENVIVERRLIAESKKDESRKDVIIRVGTPYWIEEGIVAGCAVEYDGLMTIADRKGVDPLQALQIALDVDVFLRSMGGEFQFFWPTGELYKLE